MLLDYPALIAEQKVWVAEQGSDVVGVLVQYETDDGFYIDTVAALPRMHGRGVGRALLTFAETTARARGHDALYLCTNSKMTENQVLYPRIGYVEYDRRPQGGYDRVFYRKHL
ncbi:GNAT family N-acetyltransferase [Variovorax sp. J22P168]|uniref:GNAT family N-acetyltransferase n=1 Tax=Variovorax jilinensis TaxID=3053513 RepID=UPI0025769FDF|nr:GNAT family N-acetyltransferase [Variovorax sp. J22P168]MDM0015851.1 GNAT family N-acetyltransferase [Variovorax sp. J22P168]